MNLREAAQRALEALRLSDPKPRPGDDDYAEHGWEEHNAAVYALRAALAETAMQRLTDVHQEIEKTHTSVDNEYTPVKPVAWVRVDRGHIDFHKHPDYLPLYTTLPQHKPLTDEEIKSVWFAVDHSKIGHTIDFVRAIERAHGIGGEE